MSINPEIGDLRAFLAVFDLRSFHKASDAMALSQPALSRRVQSLEALLGAKLFERSTRHVAPTQIGRGFEPAFRRLVEEFDRAILDVGWSRFAGFCRYKSTWAGGEVREVIAAYSSQTCSACGHCCAENRPTRDVVLCVKCGRSEHADANASRVILSRGTHGDAGCRQRIASVRSSQVPSPSFPNSA